MITVSTVRWPQTLAMIKLQRERTQMNYNTIVLSGSIGFCLYNKMNFPLLGRNLISLLHSGNTYFPTQHDLQYNVKIYTTNMMRRIIEHLLPILNILKRTSNLRRQVCIHGLLT